MPPTSERESLVLVLTPVGRDAQLICEALGRAGVPSEVRPDLTLFSAGLTAAGAGLIAEEALTPSGIQLLLQVLTAQPAWSDVPLLLLCAGGRTATERTAGSVQFLGEQANITILERPLRVPTLLAAVRAALRGRRRQFEARDYIEERKRHEEQLRETSKLESLGVLAGGIAHDFNNLLVGILGNASLVLDDIPPDDPNRPLVANIVRAGERAADLTRQLLAYSGKGRFVVEPVNVADVIQEMVGLLRTSITGSVDVRLDLNPVPLIEADATQIRQLVMNLVINAVESVDGRPGTVIVHTGLERVQEEKASVAGGNRTRDCVGIEVIDDGTGMDEATKARIFDPFFTTKFTGRGLGLSAVLGIVRGHGGTIHVDSTPGLGTRFRVLLPAAEEAARVSEEPEHALDPVDSTTVLVVDDQEEVRTAAKAALEHYGHPVLLAENGRRALEVIGSNRGPVGCVLLDLTMPGMTGDEASRKMLELQPDLPIIASTGYSESEAARRFEHLRLAGFVQKPYTASQLAHAVRTAIERARLYTSSDHSGRDVCKGPLPAK